jgi:hypothetical protein
VSTRTDQLTLAEVQQMPAEAIRDALSEGRCDDLLAGRDPGAEQPPLLTPPGAQNGESYASAGDWLRTLPPDLVRRMVRDSELDDLLRGES